jgi:hypothetical protein
MSCLHALLLLISAAVQAAALVPAAQRPFVPYRARSFCTQQQRQQVAGRLFGLQLVLLLQELQVPPQQQEQVRRKLLAHDFLAPHAGHSAAASLWLVLLYASLRYSTCTSLRLCLLHLLSG